MLNDRTITVSVGSSRRSTNWQPMTLLWSEFVDRLKKPQKTLETFEAYTNMKDTEKAALKDIGGFVGGTLEGTRRKASAVRSRDLVTLDLDNIAGGRTQDVLTKVRSLGISYAVYSTRSHCPNKPRLRVVLPLDRTVSVDEYEPIARMLAKDIGLELCDQTTFEASRLMYWPGCSINSEYVFDYVDLPMVKADAVLARYEDWHDVRQWPQVPGMERSRMVRLVNKQADPTKKEGIVGAFCRTYDIPAAIETFLPGTYLPTDQEDRLTYAGGSTVGGAVIYEDGKFLYSHHATDPVSGILVNAFDLVRIHKFGDEDTDVKEGTPPGKMRSYIDMQKLALEDKAVKAELGKSTGAAVMEIFKDLTKGNKNPKATADPDMEWVYNKLDRDSRGQVRKTRDNIIIILKNDPNLKGKIATDEFAMRGVATGPLPWSKKDEGIRMWTDTDDSGLNWYLEHVYGIIGQNAIDDALRLVSKEQAFNQVKSYLEGLTPWDKVSRVDTALRDYLGAEDDAYTRAVSRKSMVAAVARVYEPGCKYDYVPTFVGPQGIGKTTYLRTLGHGWHSDSLQSFKGKEASEMIQGIWINEIGEMTGYTKSDDNEIKQFLSRCDDVYRQPYGRRPERYPRKGVFFGTCNDHDFLKDPTGSRRFWPVDVGVLKPVKDIWADLPGEVDQLWAEALDYYRRGERRYMDTRELEDAAKEAQDGHYEVDPKAGMIQQFIEQPVPERHREQSLSLMQSWWAKSPQERAGKGIRRETVCALEVWCELFHGDPKSMRRVDSTAINNAIATAEGWKRNKSKRRYGYCGIQRGFEHIK